MAGVTNFILREGPPNGCVYGIKGERDSMEDTTVYSSWEFGPHRHHAEFFGVFDGHGGRDASRVAKQVLPKLVARFVVRGDKGSVIRGIRHAFLSFQEYLRGFGNKYDEQGTTAATVLKIGRILYVANIGDSRVVLCRGKRAVALTKDHKPDDTQERARIEALGGWIDKGGSVARVGDVGLATSRSFGDLDSRFVGSKEQRRRLGAGVYQVSPDPDIRVVAVDARDSFVLVACDGVWDVMKNQEACNVVANKGCVGLVRRAHAKGSTDNITALVFPLRTRGILPQQRGTTVLNPYTGRRIKRGGATHKRLQSLGIL